MLELYSMRAMSAFFHIFYKTGASEKLRAQKAWLTHDEFLFLFAHTSTRTVDR